MTKIRAANQEDISKIAEIKLKLYTDAGIAQLLAKDAYEKIIDSYQQLYTANKAQHFLIEIEGKIISCTGAFLKEDIPFCFLRKPFYGYIGDVYTVTEYRRRGYARLVTKSALDWLKSYEVEIIRLLATSEARYLYQEFGFKTSDEMILDFSPNQDFTPDRMFDIIEGKSICD